MNLCLTSGRKLGPEFIGPFQVTRWVGPVTYCLQVPCVYRINPTFHVSLLIPVHYSLAHPPSGSMDTPAPLPLLGEDVYVVTYLLDSCHQQGRLQYLVDWEGFGPKERNWIPAKDVLDPSLIAQFQ